MKNNSIKCSFKEHGEIEANSFCQECKVYMCKKCEIFHSKLLQNHKAFSLDKDLNEIFTGLCKEKNHNIKLEFFCKTHNELCCAICLCKIKKDDIGKHNDCDVCLIEDIRKEKINKLKENIKLLEEISKNLEESINKIKSDYKKLNKNKEEIKFKVQEIFTKIRNELNHREDELLFEIDKKFEYISFKEDIIKESEKLPNQVALALEKWKKIETECNSNKLNALINDCINVEKDIKKISILHGNVKKSNDLGNINITFDEEIIIEKIKKFGIMHVFHSLILTKREEIDLIFSWIFQKEKKSIELIYRASKDGDKVEDFHRLCDNKKPI